jgi:hypothetical protein
MLKSVFVGLLFVVSTLANAGELSSIAGRYSYEDYAVTLSSGRVLHLRDINATSASLDITGSNTVTLRMTMSSGEVVVQTAQVLDVHLTHGVGFWRASGPT